MPFLVKCQADYADEFDVFGFKVLSDDEWLELQGALTTCKYPLEIYFGTNEALVFDSPEDVLTTMNAVEITIEEVGVLKKFFGKSYNDSIEYGASIVDTILDYTSGAYD